jgi:hypothetical protein
VETAYLPTAKKYDVAVLGIAVLEETHLYRIFF